jgi:hypothetical protein
LHAIRRERLGDGVPRRPSVNLSRSCSRCQPVVIAPPTITTTPDGEREQTHANGHATAGPTSTFSVKPRFE